MLYSLDGISISLPFTLELFYINNEANYEALIIRLIPALKVEIRRLRVHGDLKLTIKQINSRFTLKEISLVPCPTGLTFKDRLNPLKNPTRTHVTNT